MIKYFNMGQCFFSPKEAAESICLQQENGVKEHSNHVFTRNTKEG